MQGFQSRRRIWSDHQAAHRPHDQFGPPRDVWVSQSDHPQCIGRNRCAKPWRARISAPAAFSPPTLLDARIRERALMDRIFLDDYRTYNASRQAATASDDEVRRGVVGVVSFSFDWRWIEGRRTRSWARAEDGQKRRVLGTKGQRSQDSLSVFLLRRNIYVYPTLGFQDH